MTPWPLRRGTCRQGGVTPRDHYQLPANKTRRESSPISIRTRRFFKSRYDATHFVFIYLPRLKKNIQPRKRRWSIQFRHSIWNRPLHLETQSHILKNKAKPSQAKPSQANPSQSQNVDNKSLNNNQNREIIMNWASVDGVGDPRGQLFRTPHTWLEPRGVRSVWPRRDPPQHQLLVPDRLFLHSTFIWHLAPLSFLFLLSSSSSSSSSSSHPSSLSFVIVINITVSLSIETRRMQMSHSLLSLLLVAALSSAMLSVRQLSPGYANDQHALNKKPLIISCHPNSPDPTRSNPVPSYFDTEW